MRLVSIAAIVGAAAAATSALSFADCSEGGSIGKVKSVRISPDPPVAGSKAKVTASVQLKKPVSRGTLAVNARVGWFKVDRSYDICKLAAKVKDPCPLKAGLHNFTITQEIPDRLSGRTVEFTVTASTTGDEDAEDFCFNGTADVE
ncbi:hypothetical protein GQ42DRAFT_158808 [Ramicandelaber brevisporus]|nr:hypothetical protein GQ42DRAFT_158808 [Ramicandelaber brevisporus]